MLCVFCLDSDPPPIQSGCACRSDSGLAHLGCQVEKAVSQQAHRLGGDGDNLKVWWKCQTCGQDFTGARRTGLGGALWSRARYVARRRRAQSGGLGRVRGSQRVDLATVFGQPMQPASPARAISALSTVSTRSAPTTLGTLSTVCVCVADTAGVTPRLPVGIVSALSTVSTVSTLTTLGTLSTVYMRGRLCVCVPPVAVCVCVRGGCSPTVLSNIEKLTLPILPQWAVCSLSGAQPEIGSVSWNPPAHRIAFRLFVALNCLSHSTTVWTTTSMML
jgi:hypothetical protein